MFINPNAGRVAGGELPPAQDNATGKTAGTQASPQPGQGGLQGTMVAVGEGGTSALREDAAQSRGWFGGALSAFWEAAEAFTFAMHGDPIDDDAEVRADGGADDEVRTDTEDDDTLTEVDDGEDEFFDCDDDGVAAYNARQL